MASSGCPPGSPDQRFLNLSSPDLTLLLGPPHCNPRAVPDCPSPSPTPSTPASCPFHQISSPSASHLSSAPTSSEPSSLSPGPMLWPFTWPRSFTSCPQPSTFHCAAPGIFLKYRSGWAPGLPSTFPCLSTSCSKKPKRPSSAEQALPDLTGARLLDPTSCHCPPLHPPLEPSKLLGLPPWECLSYTWLDLRVLSHHPEMLHLLRPLDLPWNSSFQT